MDKESKRIAATASPDDPRWKNCSICGERFFSVYEKVKTCGYACGNEYKRRVAAKKAEAMIPPGVIDRRPKSKRWDTPVIKPCVICGTEFAVPVSLSHRYSTCSRKCSTIRRSEDHRQYEDVIKQCDFCGHDFKPKRGVVAERRRFCSDVCRINWLNSGMDGGPTNLERWLFAALDILKIQYTPYAPLDRYVADALLPKYNIVVEVDGEYWHRKRAERDRIRDRTLASKCYTTIRFSDSVLKDESSAVDILTRSISEFLVLYENNQQVPKHSPYRVFWSDDKYFDLKEVV